MNLLRLVSSALLAVSVSAFATVTVTSPKAGSTVTSPVQYTATATAPTCSKGVGSMGIYVNNVLVYTVNGSKLSTSIKIAGGAQHTVVEEWDKCGTASFTTINLTVSVPQPTAALSASPTSIKLGASATLTATATNATAVTISGSDGSSYTLAATGGKVTVTPTATTTYTETVTGAAGSTPATAKTTVTVTAPAPTVTIGANPASIQAGSSSTLTVAATNATAVTIAGGGSTFTLPASGGTQAVSPTATTTYTVTASGPGGSTSASTTVTVTPVPAPTATIVANPASIQSGSSSTLTVVAKNATGVTISGGGSTYTLAASGGTQVVSPTATTTYTVTATGATGTTPATQTATVTVNAPPAPTVTISASPTSIQSGSSSTLTVTATNATAVSITGGGNTYTLPTTGGTQVVSPTTTTTYTVTATGATSTTSATQTATVTVTPAPAPTVTISANPTTIQSGSSSTLTVTATNATAVKITGGGNTYTLAASGGTQLVSPTTTTVYTVTATGATGTTPATQTATVTVTAAPAPTVTISANPTTVLAGASSTLTVTATNANSVAIAGTDGSNYTLSASGGTQQVNPTATTTYTATATGSSSTVTAQSTVTVSPNAAPTVSITASANTINSGGVVMLYVKATNTTGVTIAGSDGSSYTPTLVGSTYDQVIAPTTTPSVIYTATAAPLAGQTAATAEITITIGPAGSTKNIQHVIFMLQENHTFDNYFGMLNPYRKSAIDTLPDGTTQAWNIGDDGNTYNVDGIDDKLAGTNQVINLSDEGQQYTLFPLRTTCIDDDSSDWLASFGDVNRYNVAVTRPINMDGFVHTAEGYAKSCIAGHSCSGNFGDDNDGQRAMGYYDQKYLNYYYFMASQFATSDRWFSPIASKSVDNRIATFSGGTTQGLVKDPGGDDHLSGQLPAHTVFYKLQQAKATWKIYYTVTQGFCEVNEPGEGGCKSGGAAALPATYFLNFRDSSPYLHVNTAGCTAPLVQSSAVGDTSNYFCIDPNHVAPLYQYYADLENGTLPQFAFIEAGYANNDEHPGSGQPIVLGQIEVAKVVNALMNTSTSSTSAANYWSNSAFFFGYDEGGGPYDHVPPVPGHSNDKTILANMGTLPSGSIPDIGGAAATYGSGIAVNPDSYLPCAAPTVNGVVTPTWNCDLTGSLPGMTTGDVANTYGFSAQLGFRIPNFVISPFARRHYVSHVPMDHTAVIRFVEDLFIGNHQYLTARDAAQPTLLDFFDFNSIPWQTPPTPPAPTTGGTNNGCAPAMIP